MKKALIAMSGGVDSSVAAYLTQNQGYECIGMTMKLYESEDLHLNEESTCCSLSDIEDARAVADSLNMPYYVANFKSDFKKQVIDRFIDAYERCETPNPCIDCNRYLKFHDLYQRAKELECDYIVTGHYADIEQQGERFLLKKAADITKDQSYVLYSLTQEQLKSTLFPLGRLTKEETRKIAEEHGFVNAAKHDSQDICFVPDGDYAAFIRKTTQKEYPIGNFVDIKGNILGQHKGIIHYTIGQRRGLGLALPAPLYVKEKNAETNEVILCTNEELFSKEMDIKEINWIMQDGYTEPFTCEVKIRYSHKAAHATIYPDGTTAHIVFDEPQRAITKGQAAVFYQGNYVVGGGKIL